jgi:hypothetical protein
MKRHNRSLLALAATIGLWGASQGLAQAQGKQDPPPDKSKDTNRDGNRGNGSANGSGAGSGPGGETLKHPPHRVSHDPAPPKNGPTTPPRVPPPPITLPPRMTRPPTGTPPPGGYVPGNNPAPGTYPPGNSARPAPGTYPPGSSANPAPGTYVDRRRQINEQLAQRPIILAPWWYNANTWPWWYDSYFPNVGFYGNGVDDYSGWDDRGGWNDGATEARRRDRAADAVERENPATTAPPVTPPAAGAGAAALNADPTYREALAEAARLQARYDAASRKVLDDLKTTSPDYRELLAQRERADGRVDAAQASSVQGVDPSKVAPAAQRKLELNSKITQMEQDAIRRDPQASAARKALEQANARVTAMRRAAGAGAGAGQPATPPPVAR